MHNPSLSTLHSHDPFEIKLLQYDAHGPDTRGSHNLAQSTPFGKMPMIDSRRTHLRENDTRWYLPKPNDAILTPASREAIAHRFSHYYLYLYSDQFKEIVIKYDLFNDNLEKHQLPILPVTNPCSIQISPTQIFICGGIIRQRMPDVKKRAMPSGFAAIYDIDKGQLIIVSEMNNARHSHGICLLDNEVYVVGGVLEKEYSSGKSERFNLLTKQWQSLPASSFNRVNPKLCASFNSKLIYVFGGIVTQGQHDKGENKRVEVLDTQHMEWRPL